MNQMKIVPVLLLVVMMLSMTACGTASGTGGSGKDRMRQSALRGDQQQKRRL